MRIVETLRRLRTQDGLQSSFDSYLRSAGRGEIEEVPTYGQPAIVHFYGKCDGFEAGRVIVPFGPEIEGSFLINRKPDGTIIIRNEGLMPRSDD